MEVYNEAVFDLLVPPSDIHEKLQVIKKGKETVIQVIPLCINCALTTCM